MKNLILTTASLLFLTTFASGHDPYEITLELIHKRNRLEAKLELSRSTAAAACDEKPSLGVLWEANDFEQWKPRIEAAAPSFIQLLDTESILSIESYQVGLSREDDVLIRYVFTAGEQTPTTLQAPILNRYPKEAFGVAVTYRDRAGFWHPPFLLLQDRTETALPSRE